MTGSNYRAMTAISDAENRVLAEIGQTCDRVPAEALDGLLACGAIELVKTDQPVSVAPADPSATAPAESPHDGKGSIS
jgi:hypothetical protein